MRPLVIRCLPKIRITIFSNVANNAMAQSDISSGIKVVDTTLEELRLSLALMPAEDDTAGSGCDFSRYHVDRFAVSTVVSTRDVI